ncbi:MAG: PilZ domain-containing protein [Spirochaetales bacterium]|jgi:hypothetical protein|nr:PilZ domain-containing protein [Spirochaetales bacterium]
MPDENTILPNSNRRAPRKKVDIEGWYNYSDNWYPCKIYDLSVSGAGLKINQFFISGDIIRLKFGVREDFRIVEAIVVNANGTRIGVRFDVDPTMKDFIQEVMSSYHKATNIRRI